MADLKDYIWDGQPPERILPSPSDPTRRKTYYVVRGLSPEGIHETIAGIIEDIRSCWNRRACPLFAVSQGDDRRHPHKLWNVKRNTLLSPVDCIFLWIGNGYGERIQLCFVIPSNCFPVEYAKEEVLVDKCKVRGRKRSWFAMHNQKIPLHPRVFFKQFYKFLHMKLHGICMENSAVDQPRMDRLDNLEEHVKALMAMKDDLATTPNPPAEKRTATAAESSPKRQKQT